MKINEGETNVKGLRKLRCCCPLCSLALLPTSLQSLQSPQLGLFLLGSLQPRVHGPELLLQLCVLLCELQHIACALLYLVGPIAQQGHVSIASWIDSRDGVHAEGDTMRQMRREKKSEKE